MWDIILNQHFVLNFECVFVLKWNRIWDSRSTSIFRDILHTNTRLFFLCVSTREGKYIFHLHWQFYADDSRGDAVFSVRDFSAENALRVRTVQVLFRAMPPDPQECKTSADERVTCQFEPYSVVLTLPNTSIFIHGFLPAYCSRKLFRRLWSYFYFSVVFSYVNWIKPFSYLWWKHKSDVEGILMWNKLF